MEKIALTCVILAVGIAIAARLPSDDCSPTSQLLPNVDINYFSFCDTTTGKMAVERCAPGYGFIANKTASGCVDFKDFPKQCIAQVPDTPKCVGNNLKRPSSATNPNNFYVCPEEGAPPVLMTCPEGKGFVNQPGNLGCAEFSIWRAMKNCTTW